ncbi:MAG: hypothetical protein HQL67_10370 [Magnetococcales bacterium]|nr:hypothetical protein [Magnetococcales bacterium]
MTWIKRVALLFLVALLTGCSETDLPLDPKLFVKDSSLDKLQRLFMPESYWEAKVKGLAEELREVRTQFETESQRYRDLRKEQREKILLAVSEAQENGDDHRVTRRQIIQLYRQKLDRLRDESRLTGKKLREQGVLLKQASDALLQAR